MMSLEVMMILLPPSSRISMDKACKGSLALIAEWIQSGDSSALEPSQNNTPVQLLAVEESATTAEAQTALAHVLGNSVTQVKSRSLSTRLAVPHLLAV